MLKYTYKDQEVHPEVHKNYDSVLNAYRTKNLQVVEGLATVWFRGVLKLGPIPDKELNEDVLVDMVTEWNMIHGAGRVWVERPFRHNIAKLSKAIIPPSNSEFQHTVR